MKYGSCGIPAYPGRLEESVIPIPHVKLELF